MYREPQRPMRSLKSRLLAKRQSSQHKLYTTREELESQKSLRRSTTVAPSSTSKMAKTENYLVRRLAHYSSMADALTTKTKDSDLNLSNKENNTPDRNYR